MIFTSKCTNVTYIVAVLSEIYLPFIPYNPGYQARCTDGGTSSADIRVEAFLAMKEAAVNLEFFISTTECGT